MDNNVDIQKLLKSFSIIHSVKRLASCKFLFKIDEKIFQLNVPLSYEREKIPCIFLVNDCETDIPHVGSFIRYDECSQTGMSYREVCLYESETMVNTIISYEDKILDAIRRLITLLTMGDKQQEREYQNEYMVYWNSFASDMTICSVYLSQQNQFEELKVYHKDNLIRLVSSDVVLYNNDFFYEKNLNSRWVEHSEERAYLIPIIDSRGIVPPHNAFYWGKDEIVNILYGKSIRHISPNTYNSLLNLKSPSQNMIFVFVMKINNIHINFSVRIRCGNPHVNIFNKVCKYCQSVSTLYTIRKDYQYLSEQIGNKEQGNKSALLIGAGSLGSYIGLELVKNGIKRIKIYDGDYLEDANVFRWIIAWSGIKQKKAKYLSSILKYIHPELNVESYDENIDSKKLVEEMGFYKIIIFTIGSSDEQLKFNKVLFDNNCSSIVMYVWIERGGRASHILVIDYKKKGCFECLYTNEMGALVNNKVNTYPNNTFDNDIVRNGCGGTRAAYGTAVLLRSERAHV